jgi:hypothetical protein
MSWHAAQWMRCPKGPLMRGIWGVEVRRRTVRHTDFVCPRCGVDRVGNQVEPQRWFAVARFAVIPLATLPGEVVCETCGHRNDLGVLEVPTSAQLIEFLAMAVRGSIALILRAGCSDADGHDIGAAAGQMAISIMEAEGHVCDEALLLDDMARLDSADVKESLARLSDELTPHGKQGFMHRMASLTLADGPMNDRQRLALVEIGVALGMPAPHINGVIAVAVLEPEAA